MFLVVEVVFLPETVRTEVVVLATLAFEVGESFQLLFAFVAFPLLRKQMRLERLLGLFLQDSR